MQRVEVQRVIAAPIETVWARYTDHASWTDWAGLSRARVVRAGDPPPNGVGCVREFSNLGVSVDEEVVSFDPPRRMTYRILRGGLPISDHLGEVLMQPHDSGTLIIWRCQFNSRVPGLGGVFRLFITRLFRNALSGLSRQIA